MGLDNFERDPQQEQINTLFESVFKQENAQEILSYLRQITIESVAGSEISDSSLRHLKDNDILLDLIKRRFNKGQSQRIVKEKQDVR